MQFLVNYTSDRLFKIAIELASHHAVYVVSNDKSLTKYNFKLLPKYPYSKGMVVLTDSHFKHISSYLGFKVWYFVDGLINQTVLSYSDKLIINNLNILPNSVKYDIPIVIYNKHDSVLDIGLIFDAKLPDRIIVPSFDMDNGAITIVPSKYNKSFRVIELRSMLDIYNYFSKTDFFEVYSFLFDVNVTANEYNEINNAMKMLGRKKYDIHFCTNYQGNVTDGFTRNLSIISVQEGLKRIGYYD